MKNTKHPDYKQFENYLLDKLSQEEDTQFQKHLAECEECRRKISGIRSLSRRIAGSTAGSQGGGGVNPKPKGGNRRGIRITLITFSAAAVVALGLGIPLFRNMTQERPTREVAAVDNKETTPQSSGTPRKPEPQQTPEKSGTPEKQKAPAETKSQESSPTPGSRKPATQEPAKVIEGQKSVTPQETPKATEKDKGKEVKPDAVKIPGEQKPQSKEEQKVTPGQTKPADKPVEKPAAKPADKPKEQQKPKDAADYSTLKEKVVVQIDKPNSLANRDKVDETKQQEGTKDSAATDTKLSLSMAYPDSGTVYYDLSPAAKNPFEFRWACSSAVPTVLIIFDMDDEGNVVELDGWAVPESDGKAVSYVIDLTKYSGYREICWILMVGGQEVSEMGVIVLRK